MQGKGIVIVSLRRLVCLRLEKFLYTEQGKWHFSYFSFIVGKFVQAIKSILRGEEELN